MTVATTTNKAIGTGNGLTTTFPFAFGTLPTGDLVVTLVAANGTETVMVENTDYTVLGEGADDGGAIVFSVAPANGVTVLIQRILPYTQPTDYKNQGSFYPRTHERSFDRATMQIQQLADAVSRALLLGIVSNTWDAQGHRIINVGDAINPGDAVNLRVLLQQLGDFAGSGLNVNPLYWEIDGDNIETTFFIPGADVSSPLFYDVIIGGIVQEPEVDYTIQIGGDTDASTITLSAPVPAGVESWVVLRGYAKPSSDLLTNPDFIELLKELILNTLYETENVLTLGPLSYQIPKYDIVGTAETIDGTKGSYLCRTTNASPVTVTLRTNNADEDLDWKVTAQSAAFVSIKQEGAGQVTLVAAPGSELEIPPGYLAKTSGPNAIITATLDDSVANKWTISGTGLALAGSGAIQTIVSSATITAETGNDVVDVTALAVAAQIANPTNLPNGWPILYRIKDNGTARALTYGTQIRAADGVTLPTTTVVGKRHALRGTWNSLDNKLDIHDVKAYS